MTITKKEEAELLKVYNTWWSSYLSGDVKTYDSFLDDDFRFVGSTDGEEFLNRKGSTSFFEATADQLVGKAKLGNIVRTIEPIDSMVLITDLADAYILDGKEWVYYARFRFTSLMRNTSNGWRFFYQHFSTPDLKAEEGETLGIDKISSENLELRNAIKRRTAELEIKNRDLEVEAALERIRAQVTAMSQSSDLLDIVVTMRTEFVKLGHEAHYFWQMRWLPDMYQKAMTSGDGSRIGMIMELPRDFHSHYEGMTEWENNQEPYIVLALETEIAVDYIDKMIRQGNFQQVDPNAPSLDDVRHIGGLTFVSARTEHGEIGYSLPGVVKNPPKEDLDILVRFAGAFDLAHKRFEDLRRSEQQAREVEIELALEKVRSRTMAMQNSDELQEASFLLDQQVRALGIKTWGCAFNIYGEKESTEWFGNEAGVLPTYKVPRTGIFKQYYQKGQKGESLFIKEISGEKCNAHYEFMSTLPIVGDVLKQLKENNGSFPTYQIDHVVYFKYGYLLFITREPVPDAHDIFKRFSKVFEQTYTRFLDLQKAEAQAREAQIETALEKVRSRTIAMQKGEEVKDVVVLLYKELITLGLTNFATCGYVEINEKTNRQETWVTSPGGDSLGLFYLPLTGDVHFDERYEAWKKQQIVFHQTLGGEKRTEHLEYAITTFNSKEAEEMVLNQFPDPCVFYCFNFSHGYLHLVAGSYLKEEEEALLARFTKVFEQTYARFLDLQKAEEQAREAQIEAALEKVRSQSLAMHKSEQLPETAKVLFEQFESLGKVPDRIGICIFNEEDNEFDLWGTDQIGGQINHSFKGSLEEDTVMAKMYKAWKEGKDSNIIDLSGQDLKDWIKYTRKNVKLPVDDTQIKGRRVQQAAFFSQGMFLFTSNEPESDETMDLLVRFAKVFDQAFTRFLDLQKAEAQAKEAQIEAALEKIRSRSLAMHKPEELQEVVAVVAEKLKELGVIFDAGGVILCTYFPDNKDVMHWITVPDFSSSGSYLVPYFDNPIFNDAWDSKNKGDAYFSKEFPVKAKNEFFKHAFENSDYRHFPDDYKQHVLEADKHNLSAAWSKNSAIIIPSLTGAVPSDSDAVIMKRFAKVFEQAYIRFLDLQKAEAQAKEAQIEAALERVRSRTMGMQKSDELLDVGAILYQEITKLGIPNLSSGFVLVDEDKKIDWNYLTDPVSGSLLPNPIGVLNDETEVMRSVVKSWKKQEPFHIIQMNEQETIVHQTFIAERSINFDITAELLISISPKELALQSFNFKQGYLLIVGAEPLPKHQLDMMLRFTKVFEMTYLRFLDLQKAEAQAREAQIEAALERTRNQSMQMQHSDEIKDLSKIFHEQLHVLNIPSEFSYVWLPDEDKEEHMFWATWSETTKGSTSTLSKSIVYPLDKSEPYTAACYKAWASEEPVHETKISPDEISQFFDTWKELLKGAKKLKARYFPKGIYYVEAYMKYGCFGINIKRALQNDEADILHRFAIEFERAYTRFLDLQKAESQVREAQIEAALERVRSKTMAMHNSQDVEKTVVTFFDEVMKLGLNEGIRCGIGILEDREKMETWSATSYPNGDVDLQVGLLDMKRHPLIKGLEAAWKNKEDGYIGKLIGEDVVRYYEQLIEEPDYPFHVDLENLSDIEYHRSFFFSSGIIFTFTKTPISEEAALVLNRFASVFGQTYRRFLDLKKAEAQAKEAQIETALEKVRSRTMAMQASDELQEAANLLFLEVQALGINAWSAGYNILSEDKTSSICWMSSEGELQDPFPLYYTEEASFLEMGKFLKSKDDFLVQELEGEAVVQHYDYMRSLPELKEIFQHLQDVGLTLPTYQINHLCKFSQGYLLFITYESVPDAHDIFKRFTKVFEQTYTRFLDLQKAENQSKEAQIELALERVRASSMAMHKSEQLAETAEVLFEQFDLLGIIPDRMSIAIFNEKKRIFVMWSTDQNGTFVSHGHDFSIDEPTCMAKNYKAWKEGKETLIVDLKGKELKDWVRFVKEDGKMELDESKLMGRRVQHSAFFSQGYLILSSHLPLKDEVMALMQRFAKVFQQTYTRFLDLQKAETQAREAIKRTSVDRVRAEIASMRTGTDLSRITPLVWNELTTLDVPFIRCGVFIMDEEQQQVQTHLSTPDGKAIASFKLPFEDTSPLDDLLFYWRKKEMYKDYWDASAFIASMNVLMDRGAISSNESYMTDHQPDNLHLHFLPFLQGMLYVGSEVPLSEDELSLAQNLADAFSTAYSRYEDFNKLELANKKIEKTLVDLKQTQTQLVQSEKMASLGELTAGIAHEIQNPLNFVNNFSEVSAELVEEMNEEIEEGNLDFAKEIAVDLKQNLDKINHHGKRAGEIVKGMLQHSRTSSGQKELTNINALADEYLRLAYHGLRAKDKTFNAKMESNFDPDLPELNVIPQDIGRVMLNMITNAFYAVNEKKKEDAEGYEPMVSVSTSKTSAKIEIKVKDNGNGMPEKVKEKIFQPFFTTKPTGQGTGLGLSLSYDIVKAHGGELKVETEEGEGTTFIIQLTTL